MSSTFKEWEASELFCPRCQKPVPVRKKLLLVLSDGDKYDYVCSICGSSVGAKMDKKNNRLGGLISF